MTLGNANGFRLKAWSVQPQFRIDRQLRYIYVLGRAIPDER
jgi:hypothetical protein